jgi:radical SAM protein with 4Fe4S-binding SPASM domain
VCTGRGESFTRISGETYEHVLRRVAEAARDADGLIIRARCAPHFKRIALEMAPPLPVTLLHGYEAGGCLAGTRYCRVTPEGEMTPCPYMEASVGSILEEDFARLWETAPLFRLLRDPALGGRCGACEYTKLCGGCRARPLARFGDLMGEDFLCRYQPQGGAPIEASQQSTARLAWTPEAETRLARIPPFIRGFVRRRAETRAEETGVAVITVEFLHELARHRFPMAAPPQGGGGKAASPSNGEGRAR